MCGTVFRGERERRREWGFEWEGGWLEVIFGGGMVV